MKSWISHHRHSLVESLRRLGGAPLANLFNVLVIGVALSFPLGLYLGLSNLQALSARFSGDPELGIFLAADADKADASQLEARLKAHPAVARARFVPKGEALEDLKRATGLADLVETLGRNPLPDGFVVLPKQRDPRELAGLGREIAGWPKVAHVQLDSEWAGKLDAILRLGQGLVLLLAGLLGFALVAITFNTIRLQVLTRREEIQVSKLIGATNAFIRRPFLYFGTLQGLAGGGIGLLLLYAGPLFLNRSVAELARLYASDFRLLLLSIPDGLAVLGFSAALGWLGAWLSMARHLREIDPR